MVGDFKDNVWSTTEGFEDQHGSYGSEVTNNKQDKISVICEAWEVLKQSASDLVSYKIGLSKTQGENCLQGHAKQMFW